MATKFLNVGWLSNLSNAHHDGTTQQIDDFTGALVTDNPTYLSRVAALHACRQREDELWLKGLRDPATQELRVAAKRLDGYIVCVRSVINGYAGLPSDEPLSSPAQACKQVFKDFAFNTSEAYGAEADKVIQIKQNLQPYEQFLTDVGVKSLLDKAATEALNVRRLLGERALTKGEFVKGELKTARRQTDLAIAALYDVIEAMNNLMPSDAISQLVTQLKGIELYAKQYYLSPNGSAAEGAAGNGAAAGQGGNGSEGNDNQGGQSGNGNDDNQQGGGSTPNPTDNGGDNTGTGDNSGSGEGNGDNTGDNGSGGGDNGGGGYDYSNDGME